MITKKQYEQLKSQQKYLQQAKADYILGVTSKDAEAAKVIYNALGYSGPCMHCKTEIKSMYKILSKLYYEYVDKTNNKKDNGKEQE